MTQKEFTNYLTKRGWREVASNGFYFRPIVDRKISITEWKNTLVGAYCSRFRNAGAILYLSECIGKDIPQWEDLTLPNLSEYKAFLLEKVAQNTASTYVRYMSAVMNIYQDKLPTANFKTAIRVKKEPSQHVALTEEEVERIHNYQPRSKGEHDIKRAFMIECLCGARVSDVANITEDNIKDGWLTYVSQKTKTETSVPVHRYLMQYLSDKPYREEYANAVICKTMKRICMKCGIDEAVKIYNKGKWSIKPKWQFVGSHTARRSFATQLALRGVPVATISKLMGHSNVQMTSRYICISKKDIGDTAMAFFN